jgi:hypothetical protein
VTRAGWTDPGQRFFRGPPSRVPLSRVHRGKGTPVRVAAFWFGRE